MGELRDCPFCGAAATAYISFPASDYPWHIGIDHASTCPFSGLDSHCFETEERAIAEWNTRPDSAARNDALEAEDGQ